MILYTVRWSSIWKLRPKTDIIYIYIIHRVYSIAITYCCDQYFFTFTFYEKYKSSLGYVYAKWACLRTGLPRYVCVSNVIYILYIYGLSGHGLKLVTHSQSRCETKLTHVLNATFSINTKLKNTVHLGRFVADNGHSWRYGCMHQVDNTYHMWPIFVQCIWANLGCNMAKSRTGDVDVSGCGLSSCRK